MITEPHQKELLSCVYVQALATKAGYTTTVPQSDYDSVDMIVSSSVGMRYKLDLQLKATTRLGKPIDKGIPYLISKKNYDDLRNETQVPRILVVLDLPKEEENWVTVTTKELILRRCAYWLSLQNETYTDIEQGSITVYLPVDNILNVDTLKTLMEQVGSGETHES
ncbi:MAG: DUF4365 domain-containing protein [Gammaproteobacteria bacterium]|nr:DUF4365 domain-containing protein [Gammaproteobacteria bacterium]MYF53683.1 DUF4365 domain-containing protein [Gammaproteobacteria bacterium]MYK43424.1 DUF4365 domain-containing protein [Gammaproteobacteria bacterium]